ncbi:MAG: arginine--tRNA ligase [archaeon]
MKDIVVGLIAGEVDLDVCEIESLIEVPPRLSMGDFAFPCFGLAKVMKKSPIQIASGLVKKFKLVKGIERVEAKGAYVNFFVDRKVFAAGVLGKDFDKKKAKKNGKKIVIDMSSPNIAKPFGVGHLRSTIIGNSIGKICEANGFEVVKINYLGDWGTQFGKVIFGFKKWGDEKKLEKNPVEHLYDLYVRANDEKYEDDCREEFRKLENGDAENVKLWKKFRKLSLKEFDGIYDLLGIKFDVISGESFYNNKMGVVVEELRKKKLLEKNEGAEIVDLKDDELGVVLIQKSDGTSLYATRDLAAAIDRKEKYKFDKMIYEVGQEQRLHFEQLFRVLDKMGYGWAKSLNHVVHGLYLDSDGKKFATRSGKTIFMKDIFGEVVEKAKLRLTSSGIRSQALGIRTLNERARKIALAAIFYGDLKNFRENNMVFDIDKFLSFEGDTGPYLLYSYARASSILKKVKVKKKINILDFKDVEIRLLKKIDFFGEVVERAYENLAPNLVANYCFELATLFNEFYHSCPVIDSEEEGFRLALVSKFKEVLGKGLELLGIETLEEM